MVAKWSLKTNMNIPVSFILIIGIGCEIKVFTKLLSCPYKNFSVLIGDTLLF